MAQWQQLLYDQAPWALKEALVAAEAWRRGRYRRYGDYAAVKAEYAFEQYRRLSLEAIRARQLEKLRTIMAHARQHAPFYRDRLPDIRHLDELRQIPILTKTDLRQQMAEVVTQHYPARHLWRGTTSGSTGTPLRMTLAREAIRARYAILDNYYELFDCSYGQRRVRVGGSKIKPADSTEPPFWMMNRIDNQLQVSPYHINEATFPHYRDKLNAFQPEYLSGYAHAVYNLAQLFCQHGGRTFTPKVVFLDSEGVPPEYKPVIEAGFGAPVYENYGLGEVGVVAVEFPDHSYRVLDLSTLVEIVDDAGQPVADGESGRLLVTDLTQPHVPFIRYDTGDIGSIAADDHADGWSSTLLLSIDGRADEVVITPKGRRVGRFGNVTNPGRGVLESQIAQISPNEIVIRVVPAPDFDADSMNDVIHTAELLLGSDMRVTWTLVDSIPRTNRHKFKHVVREYEMNG